MSETDETLGKPVATQTGLKMRCPRRWWEVHLMESANCLVGRTTKLEEKTTLEESLRLSNDTNLL